MTILITAATVGEIAPFCRHYGVHNPAEGSTVQLKSGDLTADIRVTGVGMVKTAFEMGRLFVKSYDLAIFAGVAGAFDRFHEGQIVNVVSDRFSELGAEDGEGFLEIDQLGLGTQEATISKPFLNEFVKRIPVAKGITVNTVHGREDSIERIRKKYNPDVESMEGAAFIYAVNKPGLPALQLRAISNRVERRNRAAWKMDLAVSNLNASLIALIESLV